MIDFKEFKFEIGDKVRVLNGVGIEGYCCGWTDSMSYYVGEEYTVLSRAHSILTNNNSYKLDILDHYTFDERGLELVEKRPSDAWFKYRPKRILKNGRGTVVFWGDGKKTVVKRAEDEADNDYAAFTAALAIKIFGSNSAVKRIISKVEVQEGKKKKKK